MVEPKVVIYPFGDQTYTSTLYYGADVRESLRTLKTGSVQCVVTSPPYWGLRSYLPEGSDLKGSEIGLESMPDEYVKSMTEVFREVRRVLREDGVLWLNLGDSFAGASPPPTTYRLRADLTPDQITYVLSELSKARTMADATVEGDE